MKYKYLDNVKVIDGFYKGYDGIVLNCDNRYEIGGLIYYDVEIRAIDSRTCYRNPIVIIKENNLRRR